MTSPATPALQGCRRLFLRNYEVQINIGVHDFEKKGEQRVLINVDLFMPLAESTPQGRQARGSGGLRLHARVPWRAAWPRATSTCRKPWCDDVATAMLTHPKVRAARVSTKKPDVYPGLRLRSAWRCSSIK